MNWGDAIFVAIIIAVAWLGWVGVGQFPYDEPANPKRVVLIKGLIKFIITLVAIVTICLKMGWFR